MTAQAWYVGLDLGPRVFTAAAAVRGNDGDVAALGCESAASAGIDRGRIVDPAALRRSVGDLLMRVARRLDADVGALALTVPGSPVRCVTTWAERRARATGWQDASAAQELRLRTLRLPREAGTVVASASWVRIDGRRWPDGEPVAWGQCLRVDTESWVVPAGYVEGCARALAPLGITLDLMLPRVVAAAGVAMTPTEMEQGALAIDVGAAESDVAMFRDGVMRALFTVPHGFAERDPLASVRVSRAPFSTALGAASGRGTVPYGHSYAALAALDGAVREQAETTLAELEPRSSLDSLFRYVRRRLEELDLRRPLRGPVVLVGEGARRPDAPTTTMRELGLPARIGCPLGWQGGHGCADPALAPAIGLVLAQARLHRDDREPGKMVDRRAGVRTARERRTRAGALGRLLREFVPAGEAP